jgi:dienelactone hydrolase
MSGRLDGTVALITTGRLRAVRSARATALTLVLAIGALASVTVAAGAAPTDDAPADQPAVGVFHPTFVDSSRPSPASTTQPAAAERTLDTTIAFPTKAKRPLPLVLLAHGSNGNPDKFDELIDHWAQAGYVVVAPLFPRSSDAGGNLVGDYVEQPADLSFVLDRVLGENGSRSSPLHRRIDPKRIGLAGLSLGGFTTYGEVFNSCCRDDRIDAAILMSAVLGSFPGGEYDFRSVPTLLVHGDADGLYEQSTTAYPQLAPPKWFVTLHGGEHAPPFEDDPAPGDELVRTVTTAFWDRYLKGERRAGARIVDAVDADPTLATLQRELRAPAS